MSDIPTASTSTASTSAASLASTSQTHHPYSVRLTDRSLEIDCATTDEEEDVLTSDDGGVGGGGDGGGGGGGGGGENDEEEDEELPTGMPGGQSSPIVNDMNCVYEPADDVDNLSWSSGTSSVLSCGGMSAASDHSDAEKSILKELLNETKKSNETKSDDPITPILILVQPPSATNGEMSEIGIDMINVEEHEKRLRNLELELDYIESTEWKYRPIDSSIK